jgi:hypothetical protein
VIKRIAAFLLSFKTMAALTLLGALIHLFKGECDLAYLRFLIAMLLCMLHEAGRE